MMAADVKGQDISFSGYAMGQYQWDAKEGDETNQFNLRLARVTVKGHILNDFLWLVQGQINGNTSTVSSSPRLVDYYVEWQKLPFLKVKFGQFKRPFTFENPMNPIDQGFYSYGQAVLKLAGFSDRNGEHSGNGRDQGLQLQGDLLPDGTGRHWLHYQVGVFNGQGINVGDADNQKDLIGGLWVMPAAGLRVGAFGWRGSYSRKGTKLKRNRYALSAEYVTESDYTFRSEYLHSKGRAFRDVYDGKDTGNAISTKKGNTADGFYALAIVPLKKKSWHVKARFDTYRENATWKSATTHYEIGMDYNFTRQLQVSAEYILVSDRSTDKNHSLVDFQMNFRF